VSNLAIGFRNRAIPGVTLAGPAWSTALPISNLLTSERAMVARSVDATTGNTRFDVDFGTARAFRAFALCNHNLSQAATWTISLGTTLGASDVYAGASQAAWYLPFTGPEEWEDANWWGIAQDAYTGHPFSAFQVLTGTLNARFLRVAINDTANPAGYVQIGRLWAGEVWQPGVNATYGAQPGYEDDSVVNKLKAGGFFADEQRRRRTMRFTFDALTANEAAWAHEIQRRAGTVQELLYLPDPADYQACQRYGFVGRMRALQPLALSNYSVTTAAFELVEWL
jgi:hypothetical protein